MIYLASTGGLPGGAAGKLDAIGTITVYGGLSVLLFWALASSRTADDAPLWVIGGLAFSLTVLYAVALELQQAFLTEASASEIDILLAAGGASAGLAIPSALYSRRS
jgi:VanZ family protein